MVKYLYLLPLHSAYAGTQRLGYRLLCGKCAGYMLFRKNMSRLKVVQSVVKLQTESGQLRDARLCFFRLYKAAGICYTKL